MYYIILSIVHFLFFLKVMKLPESPTKIWSLPSRLTIQSRPLHHLLLCKERCSEDVWCSRQRGGVSWWCFGWGMRSPMGHLTSAWYFVLKESLREKQWENWKTSIVLFKHTGKSGQLVMFKYFFEFSWILEDDRIGKMMTRGKHVQCGILSSDSLSFLVSKWTFCRRTFLLQFW